MAEEHRARAANRITRTRLRRLLVHTAVRAVRIGVGIGAFSGDGLYALALLRSRCANRRTVERSRAVAACECGSSEGGRSGNQQGSKNLGLHGGLHIRFDFGSGRRRDKGLSGVSATSIEPVYTLAIKYLYR